MTKELTTRDQKRVEAIIWDGMTKKSIRELAEMTGLPDREVLAIRNGMLGAVDALTIDQRRMKLIIDLQAISDAAFEEFERTTDSRSKAPLLSAATQSMKTILDQLKLLEKTGNKEVETLNSLRRKEIVDIYASTGLGFLDWLDENPNATRLERESAYQGLLSDAAREMDERNGA